MSLLPVFLDVRDRDCLVVGGGEVAARKVERLLRAGASVRVVAPELCAELAARREQAALRHTARPFSEADLDGAWLAYAATGDRHVNARVARLAKARRLPVNVADAPALCSFFMPSILDRGPLQVAIGTGGASPVLARLLRARLETLIPAAYGELAELAAELRERVKAKIAGATERRRFWEQALQGPPAELALAGRREQARAALESALASFADGTAAATGEVYLVGAGPGDPDLLTFRALRLMQQADLVLYDRLVSPAVLDLVRRDAERMHVGKAADRHPVPQSRINELLVGHARAGRRVLRLKGGDPFIFGRGGEELEQLAEAGVPFQIVPGITAAAGCASYAGIPLTHRDHAQSVVLVTAHPSTESPVHDFAALVQPRQTIAAYMGLKALPRFCADLIRHGMDPAMPAALIERGTTAGQRVITGTCASLPERAAEAGYRPPSMLIIGEVVRLRARLAWFEPGAPALRPGPSG